MTGTRHGLGSYAEGMTLSVDLADLRVAVERTTSLDDYPHAVAVEQNVLIYTADRMGDAAELVRALSEGPGVIVFRGAFAADVVDRASAEFDAMIAAQPSSAGDHFARPGANDRVWNALQKLAIRAPDVFAEYYANDVVAQVARAWLGPGYQVTSQVNVVNPGGAAQVAHRDYHLGFQDAAAIAQYPEHVHALSPVLTLQGAVAHCDMPVETGPTLYLPYSQAYLPGYLATSHPVFRDYFDAHCVQLPLAKGDAAFFNPAVFHAAGTNRSNDVRRMANLLQISSAFGRAMESLDRTAMCRAVYPALLRMSDERALANVVAATAEGYAFPTNLDRDPPVGGLAPPTQADVLGQAVRERWDPSRLATELAHHAERRQA
jgi:ectoine hydroxylase-related dioxygenase (phytanoyl-CoA dioxygenase family)